MSAPIDDIRSKPDRVLVDIINYVAEYAVTTNISTARFCLLDTLAAASRR